MNICFLIDYNIHEHVGGGILNAILNTAQHLANNHSVSIISVGDITKEYDWKSIHILEIESIVLSQLGVGERWIHLSRDNKKNIEAFLEKQNPHAIVYHSDTFLPLFIHSLAAAHSWLFFAWFHVLHTKLLAFMSANQTIVERTSVWMHNKFIKIFLQASSGAFVLNSSAEKDVRAIGYTGFVVQFPNARDIKKLQQSDIDVHFNATNIGFIGHFSPRKNQLFLARMMQYLAHTDAVLQFVGEPFDTGYHESLKEFLQQNAIPHEFLGSVPHEHIPFVLQNAKLFVSASLVEVQSLAVLEAIASGTPIVALENETTRYILNETFAVVLPQSTTPQVFAERVDELLSYEYEKYVTVSNEAKEYANQFSFEAQEKRLLSIISKEHKKPINTPFLRIVKVMFIGINRVGYFIMRRKYA